MVCLQRPLFFKFDDLLKKLQLTWLRFTVHKKTIKKYLFVLATDADAPLSDLIFAFGGEVHGDLVVVAVSQQVLGVIHSGSFEPHGYFVH